MRLLLLRTLVLSHMPTSWSNANCVLWCDPAFASSECLQERCSDCAFCASGLCAIWCSSSQCHVWACRSCAFCLGPSLPPRATPPLQPTAVTSEQLPPAHPSSRWPSLPTVPAAPPFAPHIPAPQAPLSPGALLPVHPPLEPFTTTIATNRQESTNGSVDTWDRFFRFVSFGPTIALLFSCAAICGLLCCAERKMRASFQRRQPQQQTEMPANAGSSRRGGSRTSRGSARSARVDETPARSCGSGRWRSPPVGLPPDEPARVRTLLARPFWDTPDLTVAPASREFAGARGVQLMMSAANDATATDAERVLGGVAVHQHFGPWCTCVRSSPGTCAAGWPGDI